MNDYARPYQEGFNSAAGISGRTEADPFVIYALEEYQSAPSAPALSSAILGFISNADGLPAKAPSVSMSANSRFCLLDVHVGMNLANWQIPYITGGACGGAGLCYADNPLAGNAGRGFAYENITWRSGYTNTETCFAVGSAERGKVHTLGQTIGSAHTVACNSISGTKKSAKSSFRGGTLNDIGVRSDYWVRSNFGLSAWVQHERRLFLVIQPNVLRNVPAAVQILFDPHKLFEHSAANAPGATSATGDRR